MTKKIIDSKKKHETNGREMEQNKIKMKNKTILFDEWGCGHVMFDLFFSKCFRMKI